MINVIIADSSPLISLALINKLDLLPQLYSKVIIPQALWDEITVCGKNLPGAHEVSKITWGKIQTPEAILLEPLKIMVDRGEAEAIAIGLREPNAILLLDDSHARRVAESLKTPRIGTLGLLRRAKKAGLIAKLRPDIETLQTKGIYINKKLIEEVLTDVGENQ